MSRTHDEHDLLGVEVLEREARHGVRIGHAPDDEIDVPHPQQRQQVGIGPGDDARPRGQVLFGEKLHGGREYPCRNRRQRPDLDGFHGLRTAQAVDTLPERGEARAGIALEQFARGREEQVAAAAVEQRHAHDFLQLLDGLGGCRLAHVERVRRLDHALEPRDFQKARDVAQLYPWIDRSLGQGKVLRLWVESRRTIQKSCIFSATAP